MHQRKDGRLVEKVDNLADEERRRYDAAGEENHRAGEEMDRQPPDPQRVGLSAFRGHQPHRISDRARSFESDAIRRARRDRSLLAQRMARGVEDARRGGIRMSRDFGRGANFPEQFVMLGRSELLA